MTAASRGRSLELRPVDGAKFLRFSELSSYDPADGTRIKSQYAAQLPSAAEGTGALGLVACGDLVAAASYGEVRLPRDGAVSARIDVVVTTTVCRGRGLARATVAALLAHFLDAHGERLEHVSVIAVHPAIARILEGFGFEDAQVGATAPVLHRRLGADDRVSLKVSTDQAYAQATQGLRVECARCMWGKQRPWCGRSEPDRGA